METAQNIIAGVLSRAQSPQMGLGELMLCGDQLKTLGRVEETVLLYKTWLAFHADEPTAHMAYFNYSVLLSETGDRLGSMLALQESVKRSQSFLPPYINLGNNFEAFGQPEKALAAWPFPLYRPPNAVFQSSLQKAVGCDNHAARNVPAGPLSWRRLRQWKCSGDIPSPGLYFPKGSCY